MQIVSTDKFQHLSLNKFKINDIFTYRKYYILDSPFSFCAKSVRHGNQEQNALKKESTHIKFAVQISDQNNFFSAQSFQKNHHKRQFLKIRVKITLLLKMTSSKIYMYIF